MPVACAKFEVDSWAQGLLPVACAKFEVDSWAGAVACCVRQVQGQSGRLLHAPVGRVDEVLGRFAAVCAKFKVKSQAKAFVYGDKVLL